jgi:hypothetical protein
VYQSNNTRQQVLYGLHGTSTGLGAVRNIPTVNYGAVNYATTTNPPIIHLPASYSVENDSYPAESFAPAGDTYQPQRYVTEGNMQPPPIYPGIGYNHLDGDPPLGVSNTWQNGHAVQEYPNPYGAPVDPAAPALPDPYLPAIRTQELVHQNTFSQLPPMTIGPRTRGRGTGGRGGHGGRTTRNIHPQISGGAPSPLSDANASDVQKDQAVTDNTKANVAYQIMLSENEFRVIRDPEIFPDRKRVFVNNDLEEKNRDTKWRDRICLMSTRFCRS